MPRRTASRCLRASGAVVVVLLLVVSPLAFPSGDSPRALLVDPRPVAVHPATAPLARASTAALEAPPPPVGWTQQDPQPDWGPEELWAYDSEIGCPVLVHQSLPTSRDLAPLPETWSRCSGAWQRLSTNAPPPSPGEFLVDDPHDGYLLLGGSDLLNDTWTFASGSWTHVVLATAPSPRTGESVAYSNASGQVILFGGEAGGQSLQDTWAFSAGAWTRLAPSVSPWARSHAALAADTTDGYLVLFGGYVTRSGVTSPANDTWKFDSSGWTALAPPTAPPAGTLSTRGYLVDDPSLGGALYVGPCTYTTYDAGLTCVNVTGFINGSTWRFSNGNWTNLSGTWFVGALNSVPTYDGASRTVEGVGSASGEVTTYPDLFAFTGSWSVTPALAAPPAGSYGGNTPVMAFDPALSEIVLLAWTGTFSNRSTLEEWTFNGSGWSDAPTATPIPGRQGEGLAYDSFDGELLLYGGTDGAQQQYGDAWTLNQSGWTQVQQSVGGLWPPLGGSAFMADDPADHCVLLYRATGSPGSDTWTFAAGSWTPRSLTVSPPQLFQPSLAADSTGGFDLLYGGTSDAVYTLGPPDIPVRPPVLWGFLNLTWVNLTGSFASLPPYWAGAALADDPGVGGLILFGGAYTVVSSVGRIVGYASMNGTWIFNGTAWTNETAAVGAPMAGRISSLLAFDTARFAVVLFSGTPLAWGFTPSDTWQWTVGPPSGTFRVAAFAPDRPAIDLGMSTTFRAAVFGAHGGVAYQYSGLPLGCFGANASLVLCTPTQAGDASVSVRATDVSGVWATATTTLRVAPALALQMSAAPASVTLGSAVTIVVEITGGLPPYELSFDGLPAGCASAGSGNVTCTPTQAGTNLIHLTVRDAVNSSVNATTTLTVRPALGSSVVVLAVVGGAIVVAAVTVAAFWTWGRPRRPTAEGGARPGTPSESRTTEHTL